MCEPTFKPSLSGPKDLRYFDKIFIEDSNLDSVPDKSMNSIQKEIYWVLDDIRLRHCIDLDHLMNYHIFLKGDLIVRLNLLNAIVKRLDLRYKR